MSESDGSPDLPGDDNPLLRELEPVQLDLLEAVWDPISREVAPWPVWDYVARTLYQGQHMVADAAAVYQSLPTVPRGTSEPSYGLVWRANWPGPTPSIDDPMGLSIAGLVQLSQRRPPLRELANRLAALIGGLAKMERRVIADPTTAVQLEVPLEELLRPFSVRTRDMVVPLSPGVVFDLLLREFAPISVRQDAEKGMTAKLTHWLRPFYGVTDADGYLAKVYEQVPKLASFPVVVPSLLPQAIDYLSYVLAADPAWGKRRLVSQPDLQSPASLVTDVAGDVEFRDRMSGLARVIENLYAPALTPDVVDAQYDGRQPKSLTRLEHWMRNRLGDSNAARTQDAIADIRAAVALRNEGQHGNANSQGDARRARKRLGLPDVIWDWGNAWDTVRSRLTLAFDVLRQEAQSMPDN